jgi:hypothetical protein
MGRLCERPGCSDLAAMAYGFDVDRLLVWLAPRDPDGGDPMRAGSLCKRHADAMVVPRGWTLDDRRESQPRLFRTAPPASTPPAAAEPPAATPRRRPRRPPVAEEEAVTSEQLALGEAAAAAEAMQPAPTVAEVVGEPLANDDPDATVAIPWLPTFDDGDDLDGVLAANSPLLARAFKGTDRPR